jgi:hypothetical protein
MAQLGLTPYWHEEISRKLNEYLVTSLIRERVGH